MGDTYTNHHGKASDRFGSYIPEDSVYAVLSIKNADTTPAITIFTPHGLNCAVDYLREFRGAIESVIDALVDLGAVEE